ncbi:MAG TPA: DUF255 domain-containing protein, partial [Sulfurovum sp.]|nr:DUF255 domain-containing protein [Sulfurovum sp.]
KPFYSATYIPPEPRYGITGFNELLRVVANKYQTEKNTLIEKAEEILRFINPDKRKIEATKLDTSIITRFISQAKQLYDTQNGGFNKAPKFPQVSLLLLLLDLHRVTGNSEALDMVTHSLISMAKGGLRDLVEGGFCRYSTDDEWLVPHFEKMTYDNALLSELYLKAHHVTNDPFYKQVAFETIDFMLSKMSENNLFYSASDADNEGKEGSYFIYGYEESILSFEKAGIPKEACKSVAKALHITPQGNFEGKNIIRIDDPVTCDIPYVETAIKALQHERMQRNYPFIDKKILVSWNAMMIKTLFIAARTDKQYLEPAINCLDSLLKYLYPNSQLFHTTLIGKEPKVHAFLEDYAYLADALIEAHQTTLDEMYLITATKLTNNAIERYYNHGLWKFSRGEFETDADIYDSSYPSSLAIMLGVLHSLSSLVDTVYKKFVFKTLEIHSYNVMRQPISSPMMSRMVIRYLKDDIIIKANEEKLLQEICRIDHITYPFTYFKNDTNGGFMLCNSSSCFGHEETFEKITQYLNERR